VSGTWCWEMREARDEQLVEMEAALPFFGL
jgi:hypothetical protein